MYIVTYYSDTDFGITSMVASFTTLDEAQELFRKQASETLQTECTDTIQKWREDTQPKFTDNNTINVDDYEITYSPTSLEIISDFDWRRIFISVTKLKWDWKFVSVL